MLPYRTIHEALKRERTMPLTDAEQAKLKEIDEKFQAAAKDIGIAMRDGATTLARSAVRGIRVWLEDVEKALDLNGNGKSDRR